MILLRFWFFEMGSENCEQPAKGGKSMPSFSGLPDPEERLNGWLAAFYRVGWFIPAFVSSYVLDKFSETIELIGEEFAQSHLELFLAGIYTPHRLAAMTLHRYPHNPIIKDFAITIREAVEAHLIGLHHIAFGGLVPVIEGIGRRFAEERGIQTRNTTKLFRLLMEDCKREAYERNMGVPLEIEAMMNSFSNFTTSHLYADSNSYPLSDKTNRHGVAHGHYEDADYGTPLNFFKAISAIEVLTFVSIFRHPGSAFIPEQTPECESFLACLKAQASLRKARLAEAAAS
jgi:hypothetical protein